MKILLIDDHKLFSQSIKMILELSETIEYVDLVENFQSVDDIDYSPYDIILIDINLTSIYETDGLALAEEMIKKEGIAKKFMSIELRRWEPMLLLIKVSIQISFLLN